MEGRVNVVLNVYHLPGKGKQSGVESRYSRPALAEEVAFTRSFTANETWTKLDTGWVDKALLVVLENEEGKYLQALPSKEEIEELQQKILLIGAATGRATQHDRGVEDFAAVRPSCSFLLEPTKALYVRSCKGQLRYTVFAVER